MFSQRGSLKRYASPGGAGRGVEPVIVRESVPVPTPVPITKPDVTDIIVSQPVPVAPRGDITADIPRYHTMSMPQVVATQYIPAPVHTVAPITTVQPVTVPSVPQAPISQPSPTFVSTPQINEQGVVYTTAMSPLYIVQEPQPVTVPAYTEVSEPVQEASILSDTWLWIAGALAFIILFGSKQK